MDILGSKLDHKNPALRHPQLVEVLHQYEQEARADHLQLVLNQSMFVLLGNLAAALAVLIGSWHTIDAGTLITWFGLLLGFNLIRVLVGHRLVRDNMDKQAVDRREAMVLLSILVSGALWGSAGHLLYIPGKLDHNFFLAVPIIAMGAAAITSYAYHRIAYPLYFVPAITPLLINLGQEPSAPAKAIALITPLYFLMMYVLSRRIYNAAHLAVMSGLADRHFANHDYLTGIANRRVFEESLQTEWGRALRTGKPLSLVIADIDDFKQCNDTHGHSIGDRVLKAVAMMIRQRVRKNIDIPARIGGEEFAIILPETGLGDASRVAEDIQARAHDVHSGDGDRLPAVTLSLGVACAMPTAEGSPGALFDRADQALYRAKLEGKDRVVVDRAPAGDARDEE